MKKIVALVLALMLDAVHADRCHPLKRPIPLPARR